MIDLSPLDVRKKQDDFSRTLRGYDPDQVDSFLEMVADRLEELISERRRLSERVQAQEEQLSNYKDREQALNEALLAAQELREEARAQAEKDAELRLEEAEARAREIVREARDRAGDLRRQMEELRQRKDRFLHSLRGTLRRFRDELEVEEVRLDEATGEEPADGDATAGDPAPGAAEPAGQEPAARELDDGGQEASSDVGQEAPSPGGADRDSREETG